MKRLALIAAAALAAVLCTGGPAGAAPSYDPNVARVANPANVCKSIPGSVEFASRVLGVEVDVSSFDYAGCVKTLAKGAAFVEPAEEFGDPYAQCDRLVTEGLRYPATLHSGEGGEEDFILPDLTVKNRKECGNALYAYHAIVTYLFGGEG